MMKNRIAELRRRAGLTQVDLAERVGVSQAAINRWESGERFPRMKLLQKLAEALGVRPADLIGAVVAAEVTNELDPSDEAGLTRALHRLGASSWRVTSDSVELSGVGAGSVILVRAIEDLIGAEAGAIIVLQSADGSRVIRQFIPPSLVTTNRRGTNIAMDLQSDETSLRVVGVVIPNG